MKKITINYFALRIISAILLGMVLLLSPQSAMSLIVITIGVLFTIPGLLAFINYLLSAPEKRPEMVYMLAGLGSLLFGVALVVMPSFFVTALMYILGTILFLGGIEQFIIAFRARKHITVPLFFYLFPLLLLTSGVIVLANPAKIAGFITQLIGVMCLVYGIMEMVYWIKFKRNVEKTTQAETVV